MGDWYWVILGALIGAPLRYGIGRAVAKRYRRAFPLGTFLINVTGSFLLGLLFVAVQADWARAFLGTGLLGAYTTFSTFGTEAVGLLEQKKVGLAALYVFGSAVVGIAAAWLGGTCYTG